MNPALLLQRPFSRIALGVTRAPAAEGSPVLFWNGLDVEARPFSFQERMQQELEWIIDRMGCLEPFPATVIDAGGGVGCFSLLAAERYRQSLFVNLDINAESLEAFSAEARSIANTMVRHGTVLDPGIWREVKAMPKPLAVHTCASIFWLSKGELETLFRRMLDAGVTHGIHWEFQGWRTETGKRLERRFPGLVYRKERLEFETDPYDVARDLRLDIIDRVEVPPHFLGQHLPSFFVWRKP